jgi:hypothetical protein
MRPIKYQLNDLELDSVDEDKHPPVFQINTPRIDIRRAMEKVETAIAAKDKKRTNDLYHLVEIVKPKLSLYDEYMNLMNPGRPSPTNAFYGLRFNESPFETGNHKSFALNYRSKDHQNLLYNTTPKNDIPIYFLPKTTMKVHIDKRNMNPNKSTSHLASQTMTASRYTTSSKNLSFKPKKTIAIDSENMFNKTQAQFIRPHTKNDAMRTTTAELNQAKFRSTPVREGTLPQLLGFKKGKVKIEAL